MLHHTPLFAVLVLASAVVSHAQTTSRPDTGPARAVSADDSATSPEQTVRHRMSIALKPADHRLVVVDTITLPSARTAGSISFTLAADLEVRACEPPAKGTTSPPAEGADPDEASLKRYVLERIPADGVVRIEYEGALHYGLSDQKEEYTRGFRESRGVLGPEGVYLHGGSGWFPRFGAGMVRFELTIDSPEGWQVISAGAGTSRGADGQARWSCDDAVDDIHLVGGPLHVERAKAGRIETLVYLHEADEALARRYLDAAGRYLDMYEQLIGPYPYTKFALVENFWETGYGMPSFTLLGPRVIRFPFIITSSYPHEILHNWWGNSVFVDYASGNWCEGLTAYLADHLIQEQQGQGAMYRRAALQKYRDYVKEGRDFPLADFHSRHDAATEAVGYGKSLMLFHMLRRQLGDPKFRDGLADLYHTERGKRASFADVRRAFERASSADLATYFDQWTKRKGAPVLELADVKSAGDASAYRVTGSLNQTQAGEPFPVQVPLYVRTAAGQEGFTITCNQKNTPFEFPLKAQPLTVAADPFFDVFRLLDPLEAPASIGQIFGEPEITAILPAKDDLGAEAYRKLVESWQSENHHITVVDEADVDVLPTDRSVWVLGRGNRFNASFLVPHGDVSIADFKSVLKIGDKEFPFAAHTFVAVRRHHKNPQKAIGWIVVDPPAAIAGLARKLPHYGKYSYLAFQGDEPANIVKGLSEASDSPLVVNLANPGEHAGAFTDDRRPLVEPPPTSRPPR